MDAPEIFDWFIAKSTQMPFPDDGYIHISNKTGWFTAQHTQVLISLLKRGQWLENITLDIVNDIKIDLNVVKILSGEISSGHCAPGFAFRFVDRNVVGAILLFANALKSGLCPPNLILNFTHTRIGREGIAALIDALKSGFCPRGLSIGIGFRGPFLSGFLGLDVYMKELTFFLDGLEDALASGRCPPNLTIFTGCISHDAAELILTRLKRMSRRNLFYLKGFRIFKDSVPMIDRNMTRGDFSANALPWSSEIQERINNHINDANPLRALEISETQRRHVNLFEESIERNALSWLRGSEYASMMLMREKEKALRNGITTHERYMESLKDANCPVCYQQYNDTNVLRLVLIPCHHLLCQSCWVSVQAYAYRGMNCPVCRGAVTRFEATPPIPPTIPI